MKKILIYPYPDLLKGNLYLENLSKTINDKYIIFNSSHSYFFSILFSDVILLNWFESINSNFFSLIKRLLFLFLAKALRKKIIWTIHNREPHDGIFYYEKFLIILLVKKTDRIHILCKETLSIPFLKGYEKKCILIPHGDYFNNFRGKGNDIHNQHKIPKNQKIILFTGAIRPYKNIELLINAFSQSQISKKNYSLLIRGLCKNELYQNELKKHIKNDVNIFIDFSFIPNEEMESYLNQSICLVAPYQKDSVLNSGTLWMAFSYAKTIIIPSIGSVKDIPNNESMLYLYSYSNKTDHQENLCNIFKKISHDMELNPSILQQKGIAGYKLMQENSWNNNKKKWEDLFLF